MTTHSQQKSSRNVLSQMVLAGILIYGGLVLMAETLHMLPATVPGSGWDWFMMGAGGLLLLESVIRAVSDDYNAPRFGKLALGVGLLVYGAARVFGLTLDDRAVVPVVLMFIGIMVLMRNLRHP